MKKYIFLALTLALLTCMVLPAVGFTETVAATVETAAVGTIAPANGGALTDIITQVVIWIIGGLFGLAALLIKRYVLPWMENTIIPWLQARNLTSVAREVVRYAEATLGRYTGEEKWALALETLKSMGWNIDCDEVVAALKAEWTTLNIEQIAAGIKKNEERESPISSGNGE